MSGLTTQFRPGIDKPQWVPVAPINAGALSTFGGTAFTMATDLRSRKYAHPELYLITNSTSLYKYNYPQDAWQMSGVSPSLLGSYNSGTININVPSQGPRGLFLGTNTTTKLNLDSLSLAPAAASWTRTTTTATITTTRAHGFTIGQVLSVTVTSDASAIPIGNVTITAVGSTTTFTFTCLNAGGASGTLTIGVAVNPNQLANRGDGLGYIIRVINYTTGKIEERRIVANTGGFGLTNQDNKGAAPTVYLDQPLSNAPGTSDAFEILSGRNYILTTGAPTAGMFKYIDIATNTLSGSLATTNLPTVAITGNNQIIPLDEQLVPCGRYPGEGFIVDLTNNPKYDINSTVTDYSKRCLTASAISASTITGHTVLSVGDNQVLVNEYRNFQIRIVEDTTNPTAVNQRRKISYHTAGSSGTGPIYTLASNWTVTPSSTCKFVIENDNDKMIFFNSGSTTIYNYVHPTALSGANAWDTTTWATRTSAMTSGFGYQFFGINVAENALSAANGASALDPEKQVRNSHIISLRGNNTVIYDIFDIANSASGTQATTTGNWISGHTLDISTSNFMGTAGNPTPHWIYVPFTQQGKYIYLQHTTSSATSPIQIFRLDIITKKLEPYGFMRTTYSVGGTAQTFTGEKGGCYMYTDNSNSLALIYFPRPNASTGEWFQCIII